MEAVLVASRRGFGPGRVRRQGMSEGDSHSPSAAENAVAEVRRTRVLRSEDHQECATLETAPQGAEHRARVIRSCRRNVNCAFTRVVRWGLGSVVRDALRASASLTSRIERSPGARVENRLQKSVRRIFLAAGEGSREALFERGVGSVRR